MFGKDTIVISLKLFLITAVAALCLAFVNGLTEQVIEINGKKAEAEAMRKVLSAAKTFSEVKKEFLPKSKFDGVSVEKLNVGFDGENAVGYVVTAVSKEGYGGDIKVMVGLDGNMAITRVEILESSETAGLGANASKPAFAGQFEGKNEALTLVKGTAKENEISAIASATITSKAVTGCVNAAMSAALDAKSLNPEEAFVSENNGEGGTEK